MKNSRFIFVVFSVFVIALVTSCALQQQRTGNFSLILDEASVSKMLSARGNDTSDSTQISITIQLKGEQGSGVDKTQTATTSLAEAKSNPITVTFVSVPLNITFDVIVSAYIDGELFYYGTSQGSSSAGDVDVAVKMAKLTNTRCGIWDNTSTTNKGITFVRKPSQYQAGSLYLSTGSDDILDYCFDADGNYYVVVHEYSDPPVPVKLHSDNKAFLKKHGCTAAETSANPQDWYVEFEINPSQVDRHVTVDYANGNVYVMTSFVDATEESGNIIVLTKEGGSMKGLMPHTIEPAETIKGFDFAVYDNYLYIIEHGTGEYFSPPEKTATLNLTKYLVSKDSSDPSKLTATKIGNTKRIFYEAIPEYENDYFTVRDVLIQDGNLYVLASGISCGDPMGPVLIGEDETGPHTEIFGKYYGVSRGMLFKIDMETLSVLKTVGYRGSPSKMKTNYGYEPTSSSGKYYVTYDANGGLLSGNDNRLEIYAAKDSSDVSAFINPVKFVAVKPGKLVIADDGIIFYTQNDVNFYEDANRIVTVDLDTFAMTAENMPFQFGAAYGTDYDEKTGFSISSPANPVAAYSYRKKSGIQSLPGSATANENVVLWPKKLWDNDN